MKTLVIVWIPGSVLSLDADDFPMGGPVEGRTYEFAGKLYRVSEITETLGTRGLLGEKLDGYSRILTLADAVSQGDEALKQKILTAKKVGVNAPDDEKSAGGLILPTAEKPVTELSAAYDHILFVKALPVESSNGVRLPRGLRLTDASAEPGTQNLVAESGEDGAGTDQNS
ncbi:MAG: hypothetical protein K2X27_11925 [Candidatus Obscuribacterales bacterium]|nr:hypothetical protein [Candidatus Obscuribacterales bacterium]